MMAKICVMTSAHPVYDARIFHKQCRSLAGAGYRVTLIAPGAFAPPRDGIHFEGVPVRRGRLGRMSLGCLAVLVKAFQSRADLYHFHDPELIPAGLILRLAGKRVIYDIHEDLPRTISYKPYIPPILHGLVTRLAETIERRAARFFSALIPATAAIAGRFRRTHPLVEVVHNYPRLEEIGGERQQPGPENGSLVYVGMRITQARGAEEMVRAMGLLPPQVAARLTIVGAWDPPELARSLSVLPGWERIDSLGLLDRPQLAKVLRKAGAGLVLLHPEPNYLNALPVKLFEYMCAGIPVIASDLPGCREIVESAQCGLLVEPSNARALADAITYLWHHPAEARRMGQRGLQAVQSKFSWDKEEKKLLGVYRRLNAFPGAAPAAEVQL